MLVSICIPAYNQDRKIERLLDSIVLQSFRDFEVIVTDDSDDDRIERVVQKFTDRLDICYIRNKIRLGATRNCNAAISHAKGKLIKLMHQDDWFSTSESLAHFVNILLDNPSFDMAFSATYQVSETAKFKRTISPKDLKKIKSDYRYLFIGNYIGAPSATIMRNKGLLFDDKLKWLVDMELYMRILSDNSSLGVIDEPLISIGVSDTQLTNECLKDWKMQINEQTYVFKKHKLFKNISFVIHLFKLYLIIILKRIGLLK